MLASLKPILEIQELDMKMIRLMILKRGRLREMEQIDSLRKELKEQIVEKRRAIAALDQEVAFQESRIAEIKEKVKKLEARQSSVKKVDEFNAITQEMSTLERSRVNAEQTASDMIDKKNLEEEVLQKFQESLDQSEEGSRSLEKEILQSIRMINQEGKELKEARDQMVQKADPEILKIYERLLKNKKDRVVVPLEKRVCSGCHIALTPQHENVVRRGDKIVFCEHCSRIHYWIDLESSEVGATKRRRRRPSPSAAAQ